MLTGCWRCPWCWNTNSSSHTKPAWASPVTSAETNQTTRGQKRRMCLHLSREEMKDDVEQLRHSVLCPDTWSKHKQQPSSNRFFSPLTLMSVIPRALVETQPTISSHSFLMNWCGTTNTSRSAPSAASRSWGTATWEGHTRRSESWSRDVGRFSTVCCLTTFSGSLYPGRYLMFSWSMLMMSVNFLPLMFSSNTHIFTVVANRCSDLALLPMILAMAEPLEEVRGQPRNNNNNNSYRWFVLLC